MILRYVIVLVGITSDFCAQGLVERVAKQFDMTPEKVMSRLPDWENYTSTKELAGALKKRLIYLRQRSYYRDHLQLVSLYDFLPTMKNVQYQKIDEATLFRYKPFEGSPYSSEEQPHAGLFAETFVLTIPYGKVCSDFGWVMYEKNIFFVDFLAQQYPQQKQVSDFATKDIFLIRKPQKWQGSIAVITRKNHTTYGHWMIDVLGRLLLLKRSGVHYDYLYVPQVTRFQRETLAAWGVPREKIIEPFGKNVCIEAEKLIVPSLAFRRIPCEQDPVLDQYAMTHYWPSWIIQGLRDIFLPKIKQVDDSCFAKKVFLSRKDASRRCLLNEDELYAYLHDAYGFERYILSELSFLEQVALFYHADIIIGLNGSSLTNLIFCKPHTKVIELFQERCDTAFYNLSQEVALEYYPIKTTSFSLEKNMKHTYVDKDLIAGVLQNLCS